MRVAEVHVRGGTKSFPYAGPMRFGRTNGRNQFALIVPPHEAEAYSLKLKTEQELQGNENGNGTDSSSAE